jgi:hypothetical protein
MRKYFKRLGVLFAILAATTLLVAAVTQIDLTTQVKNILPAVNGGTGNGFTAFSGPATSTKTFTLPNASATILTSNSAVTMAQGGTGITTNAADTLLQGTSSAWQTVAMPTTGTNGCAGTGDKLLYSTTTHLFTCGTDQTTATNFADAETPSGTIDGSNAVFTLAHTPSPAASLKLFKNGQLMIAGGADYTLATATATYVSGAKPQTGDVHIAFYRW